MSSSRPKRKCTSDKKPAIIDITDSEEENVPAVKKRKVKAKKETIQSEEKKDVVEKKTKEAKIRAPRKAEGKPKPDKVNKPENEKDSISDYDYLYSKYEKKPWKKYELLAELENIPIRNAQTIIDLFDDENTIPFMCRYRRDLIGDILPEKLRDIKSTYNQIVALKSRSDTILKNLEKEDVLVDEMRLNILSAKTLEELEHLYAPFKPANKGSLAERAKALGLEAPADIILNGSSPEISLNNLVKLDCEGLQDMKKIEEGIVHIIAHNFSKNSSVLDEIRRLQSIYDIYLHSTKTKAKVSNKSADPDKKGSKKTADSSKKNKTVDEHKFENYFDFQVPVKYLKSHQILALNRGENLKVLSIKITLHDRIKIELKKFISKQFLYSGKFYRLRTEVCDAAFEEAFNKKLTPLICRQTRNEMTKKAEKSSIEVFASNLKQLLLTSPVKGEKILGIDPGFAMGCKLALISECSDVLETGVIYPHTKQSSNYGEYIANILNKHNCGLIALGNGTACRETEAWLTKLFEANILDKNRVKYSIVAEQGASIYSCGEIAKKEFPKMDVNLISAVSIARRLNDPLCEYVKIDAKHLGVGMYQHDINEKQLTETLDEVVMECVSFVGVDINTASVSLLSHIAGLTNKRAEYIIEHRKKNGVFKTRQDLMKVKFIGEKIFTQCAGFVRIEPLTAGLKDYNKLDSTWVHPETYNIAERIIEKLNLTPQSIGAPNFIQKMTQFSQNTNNLEDCAIEFNEPIERIRTVVDALQRQLFQDYRSDLNNKPLFKKGLTKMSDLKVGTIVTGAVNNVTDFGCFVDIGVETTGLIHVSKMNGQKLRLGDKVETSVLSIEMSRNRIGLKLEKVI